MASSDLSSKLDVGRPILAALTALLVLLATGAGLSGPMSSFALGLPVLAMFASWLARTAGSRQLGLARLAGAALLVAPAVGFRATRVAIDVFDAAYLLPEDALFQTLSMAANAPRNTGPMLLAAAAAAAVGLGRYAAPAVGAYLGGAAAAVLGRQLLQAAGQAWHGYAYARAARLAWLAGWVGAIAIGGGLLGILWARRQTAAPTMGSAGRSHLLLSLLVSLTAAWASSVPIQRLTRALPAAMTQRQVQVMPRGRSFAAPVLDPAILTRPGAIGRALESWNFRRLRPDPWPCEPLPPQDWAATPRNAVIVPLPPEHPIRELVPLIDELVSHGAYDLVLPGESPALPGDYGAHMRWSGTSLLLDRPPAGALWIAADPQGWQVVQDAPWFAEGHAICVLIADRSMSVGQLTRLAYLLSEPGKNGPCQDALALAPLNPSIAWESDPQPAGCASLADNRPVPEERPLIPTTSR